MTRTILALTFVVASASLSGCASSRAAEIQAAQAQKDAHDARHREAQRDFDRARANQEKEGAKPSAPSR